MARTKGKVAEREVAALLEAWWTPHEPKARFVRTPQSGGWHGADVRAEFRTAGDIMTTAKTFAWCVEVKRREGWSWKPLLAGKPSPIWKWWAQTKRDAAVVKLRPMLWFRHSREPWTVVLDFSPVDIHPRFVTLFSVHGDALAVPATRDSWGGTTAAFVRADVLLAVRPARLLPSLA